VVAPLAALVEAEEAAALVVAKVAEARAVLGEVFPRRPRLVTSGSSNGSGRRVSRGKKLTTRRRLRGERARLLRPARLRHRWVLLNECGTLV